MSRDATKGEVYNIYLKFYKLYKDQKATETMIERETATKSKLL